MNSRQKGIEAEDLVCNFLLENGYEIVERNFSVTFSEIDIIAKKDNILHFVEVKSGVKFDPIQNITPKKIQKIYKGIGAYLSTNRLEIPYCVDVALVRGKNIEFIDNVSVWL